MLGGIRVFGDATCPTVAGVENALAELGADRHPSAYRAHLSTAEGNLHLELLDDRSQIVAERELTRLESCDELARVVAVVLSVWEAELVSRVPEVAQPDDVAETAVKSRASTRSGLGIRIGGGPAGSIDSSGLAAAGVASADLLFRNTPWGIELSLSGQSDQQLSLPSGVVRWNRWSVAAGVLAQWLVGFVALEGHADAVLALLSAHGEGFQQPSSAWDVDLGVRAGIKLTTAQGHIHPWLGCWGTWWPRPEQPFVSGAAAGPPLPNLELMPGLGVSFDLF